MKKAFRFRVERKIIYTEIIGRYKTVKGVLNCFKKHHKYISFSILDIKEKERYTKHEFLEKFTTPNTIRFIKSLAKGVLC